MRRITPRPIDRRLRGIATLALCLLLLPSLPSLAAEPGARVIARGAESYGPVTPIETRLLRELAQVLPWLPGDPIKEVPRRFYPAPGRAEATPPPGLRDPLLDLQLERSPWRAPTIDEVLDFDGQGFSGATPPDTVGDVGPNHYVQAVNASLIAIYDKTGTMLPGFPIALESLAPSGPCTSGFGDPIVLYDWLADRWFLQEFTGGGNLCIYISATSDPTGSYHFYEFLPPDFPDYPHYGVWSDAYYAGTNEANAGGNQTTYAFDRAAMLAGAPATMQRLTAIPPVSGYGFQLVTPADHDGDTPPPAGAPGIFMRHYDDEAHGGTPDPATDRLEIYQMEVDWNTPANTQVVALTPIEITDYNSWFVDYSTFYSVPQPSSSTRLDPIREAIMQRLVYRNMGTHEVLLGTFATNRDPATAGDNVEAGNRWFELRRTGGIANPWTLFQEGTFGGDSNSPDANFFMGSVAMDGAGNIALGYSKTDVSAASPLFPSLGYAGRLESDPAGTLGPENVAVLGVAASGSGRWGDYADLSIDPADDCTFWFTGEYMPGGSWGTRITSFLFQECLFGYILAPTPSHLDVCAPTDPDPVFSIDVTAVGGWTGTVTLSASGEPPGTSVGFAPNGVAADFTSILTVTGTDASTTGAYTLTIDGLGDDLPPTERATQVTMNLAVAAPAAPALVAPGDGELGVTLLPTFQWNAASDATSYQLEVATDAGFGNVVYAASGLGATEHTLTSSLDPSTTYYWRVSAENVCDQSQSTPLSFTTVVLICETFVSSDVPLPIPEGGGTSGVTESTLLIGSGSGGVVADVDVLGLVGTHTYMGDLDFNLVSPTATSVEILGRRCGTDENFDIGFDDEAAPGDPPCPPTDGSTYQPSSPLAAFDGEDSKGTWTLLINDNAGGDEGVLDGWGLRICVEFDENLFADGFETGDASLWSLTMP